MTSPHESCLQSEASDDEIRERIMHLFSTNEDTMLAEREIEKRVSAVIQDFLRATEISSGIEVESLSEKFIESRIPPDASDTDTYIDYLIDNVVAHSIRISSPRFMGHMTSGLPYFVRPLGELMVGMNQNVVKSETSKALTPYERQATAMVHRLIYNFPDAFYEEHIQRSESTLGIMVSGGTLANITALWAMRNCFFGAKDEFAGVEEEGLPAAFDFYGYSSAVVIGSSLIHYSFEKAVDILGIGTKNLIKIPADRENRIDLSALRRVISECHARNQCIVAIVGVAGATDSGSVDPLSEMADIAQEAGVYFHVDAAWGGPVLFSQRHRHKLAGIERADSVTIDGHKQMYLPMGIGLLALRNPHMAKAIEKQARYIVRAGSADLGRRALEGSRPGMALFLHAALNIIGRKGYEFLIDEGIKKTRYLADSIRSRPEFELLAEPQINILIYRYIPEPLMEQASKGELTYQDNRVINDFNERLQKAQRQAGHSFVSRTTVDTTRYGRGAPIVALRAVIANPGTTERDIDSVLDDQTRIAKGMTCLQV